MQKTIKMTLLRPDVLEEIQGRSIILDTNAFVEGYSNPSEFSALLDELAQEECNVTTIDAVRIEFLSKNRSTQELHKKVAFYQQVLTYPELPTRTFEPQLHEASLLYAFGRQAQAFKAVDFMIAAAMKKYSGNTLLLTNDHHDFTSQLFDLKMLIPLMPSQGCVITLGLYAFSEEKYALLIK